MLLTLAMVLSIISAPVAAADEPVYIRTQDVVYGRKHGTALTMDIFEPKGESNGATVLWLVSGGWYSSHDAISADSPHSPVKALLKRGYRVCAVVHGSNPLFTIEDAIMDVQRSIRFVQHKAMAEKKTTVPLGIVGGSAGGHLSLMAATAGDDGNAGSKDPVERQSSRVQAAACYFPPTDFLNYGAPGINAKETTVGELFVAPFQFRRLDPETKAFALVTDKQEYRGILAAISPVTHVSDDDAPSLLIHGDADNLVPYQQAEIFIEKMKAAGVETELICRPGAGHGWANIGKDHELLADWMDEHLLPVARP